MGRLLAPVLIGWVIGVQMAIGYMAAPMLFARLDSAQAGELVGSLLVWAEAVGVGVIAVVSVLPQRPLLRGLLALAALAQLVQLGWLNPKMASLKAAGLEDAAHQAQFMQLHGISQGLFLSGIVLLLLWLGLWLRAAGADKQDL